jgi:hypothetical protein
MAMPPWEAILLRGQANGTFASFDIGPISPRSVGGKLVADFNGDGKPDLFNVYAPLPSNVIGGTAFMVTAWNGTGAVVHDTPTQIFQIPGCESRLDNIIAVVALDVDGDHKTDVVALPRCLADQTSSVGIAFGNGDGTFPRSLIISNTRGAKAVAACDLNADGKVDLAVSFSDNGNFAPFYGDGAGHFSATPP